MAIMTGQMSLQHLLEVADGGASGALPVFVPRSLRVCRLEARGYEALRDLRVQYSGHLSAGVGWTPDGGRLYQHCHDGPKVREG